MAKIRYFEWYYSAKVPIEKDKRVIRVQDIKDGPSTKATRVLGQLKIGDLLTIDMNEVWNGWYRIIRANGHSPVPLQWFTIQADKLMEEREWWIDQSALGEVATEPEPEPAPRKWTYKITVEEIAE